MRTSIEDLRLETEMHRSVVVMQTLNPLLILEPLGETHIHPIYDTATPKIWCLTRLPVFKQLWHIEEWVRLTITDPDKHSFAMIHQDRGFVGLIALTRADDLGSIYYWVGEQFWGNGFATCSATRLLSFAFDELSLEAVFGYVSKTNCASIRIMEKLALKKIPANNPQFHFFFRTRRPRIDYDAVEKLADFLTDIRSDLRLS